MKLVKYALANRDRLNAFYVRYTAWYWSVCDLMEINSWVERER